MPQNKSIQKAHTADVVPSAGQQRSGQLGTIFGIEAGDIRIPYVYLVRSGSKNAKDATGNRVKAGMLYHSVKKEAYEDIEVLVAHATKGIATDNKKDANGNEVLDDMGENIKVQSPCYRAIMLPVDNPSQPFMTTFKGYNLFTSWKDFISELASTGRTNLDVVVKISSKDQETNYGYTEVFDLKIVREATEEERNLMLEASRNFGAVTQKASDEELASETIEHSGGTVDQDDGLDFLNDKKSKMDEELDNALGENATLDDILKGK